MSTPWTAPRDSTAAAIAPAEESWTGADIQHSLARPGVQCAKEFDPLRHHIRRDVKSQQSLCSLFIESQLGHPKALVPGSLTLKITGLRGFSRRSVDCRVGRLAEYLHLKLLATCRRNPHASPVEYSLEPLRHFGAETAVPTA